MSKNRAGKGKKALGLTASGSTAVNGGASTRVDRKRATAVDSKKPTLRPRKCRHCGTKYRPTQASQRYCSTRCRQAAWAREHGKPSKGVELEPATCEHCARPFWKRAGRDKRYCSASCRVMASRVRKAATIRAFAEYTGKLEHEAADIADASSVALKGMQTFLAARGLVYEPSRRAWVALLDDAQSRLVRAPKGEHDG